jgi:hypothetical protein
MTLAQKGLLRELLDEDYLKDGLPPDPAAIAQLLALPLPEIESDLTVVLQRFRVGEDGRLRNDLIGELRAEQNDYRRSRRANRMAGTADQTATCTTYDVTSDHMIRRDQQDRTGHDNTGQDIKHKYSCSPVANDGDRELEGPPLNPAKLKPTKTEVELSRIVGDANFIYRMYPRKVGRAVAVKAIYAALRRLQVGEERKFCGGVPAFAFLQERVKEFAQSPAGKAGQYCPHPKTWFTQSRYLDDPKEWQRDRDDGGGTRQSPFETLEQKNARLARDYDQQHPEEAPDFKEKIQ